MEVYQEVRPFFPSFHSEVNSHLAGGFDAIWLLVLEPVDITTDGAPVARVEETWARAKAVSPLLASESLAKGCRVESLDSVKGLKAAISRP